MRINLHAETVAVGGDVANHLALLDVPDLVSRVDAESVHAVVNVSRSGEHGRARITVRSNENRIHIALHGINGTEHTRSFSSSFRTKYFRKWPMNCIEKSLT